MDRKLVKDYAIVTGLVWIVFWGGCVALCRLYDVSVQRLWMRIPFMIGGFSPTIGSYVALKRNGRVRSFGDWLERIFRVRCDWRAYALVALFTAVYFALGCLFSDCSNGAPLFMALVLVPAALLGGGNEEAGWRMVLQPELEKRIGFHGATIAVGVVWWLWHLPLFFMKGTSNAEMNFFLFGVMCLALSYALATLRRVFDNVFLCVLLHCLINGLSAIFVFRSTPVGCLATLAATVAVSIAAIELSAHKAKKAKANE